MSMATTSEGVRFLFPKWQKADRHAEVARGVMRAVKEAEKFLRDAGYGHSAPLTPYFRAYERLTLIQPTVAGALSDDDDTMRGLLWDVLTARGALESTAPVSEVLLMLADVYTHAESISVGQPKPESNNTPT
jgi:hypothetical protein